MGKRKYGKYDKRRGEIIMKTNFSFKYGDKAFTAEAFKSSGNTLVCELEKGVTVTAVQKEYPESKAVEWVLWFENISGKDSLVFSEINDCDATLTLKNIIPYQGAYRMVYGMPCITAMKGMVDGPNYQLNDRISATEYELQDEYPYFNSTKSFKNISSRSSDGTMPFFDVHAGGNGAIVAIGWTGGWRADFTRTDDNINIKTGLQNAEFYLKDGEKLRTSSILIMEYSEEDDKSNNFRKLIRENFSHKACTKAEREGLLATELWGSLPSDEMVKRLNEFKKYGVEFEDVWIDAGWYGTGKIGPTAFDAGWSEQTGDWRINTDVHKNALCDVRDAANEAGMNIMLWFEPERAVTGTPITKEHPEWFLKSKDDNGNVSSNNILYYGNDEAFDYAYKTISDKIEKLKLSCYRQDFNTQLTTYFEQHDEENRRGITEIKHITGMYRLWEKLLESYPHLIIDNCSSGGRRIDIETLKRSIPFFRSDYQCNFNSNPNVLQTHNSNISLYLPYNGCTNKTNADTYSIRSSYSSSWGGAFYNAIFQSMTEDNFEWAANICREYKSIRKYFSQNFYNHASRVFDDTAWCIWQYHDTDSDSGIVMAFRRENSPNESAVIDLKGITGDKTYNCINIDTNEEFTVENKLEITLKEKRSSVIIKYF